MQQKDALVHHGDVVDWFATEEIRTQTHRHAMELAPHKERIARIAAQRAIREAKIDAKARVKASRSEGVRYATIAGWVMSVLVVCITVGMVLSPPPSAEQLRIEQENYRTCLAEGGEFESNGLCSFNDR